MVHESLNLNRPSNEEDPYQIEKMKPIHLPDVIAIEKKSFPQPWSFSLYLSELSNRMATYLVLLFHSKVVGYIGLWTLLDEAHITTFAIHPNFRRHGLGKKLFQYALDFSHNQGCREILLEVRVSNIVAQNLYRTFGFTSYGIRKKYYNDGEDALLMKKIYPENTLPQPDSLTRWEEGV